jgi:hypothetical protein
MCVGFRGEHVIRFVPTEDINSGQFRRWSWAFRVWFAVDVPKLNAAAESHLSKSAPSIPRETTKVAACLVGVLRMLFPGMIAP